MISVLIAAAKTESGVNLRDELMYTVSNAKSFGMISRLLKL